MPLIVRHRRIDEVVKGDESVDIRPDILIARVEDVRAILMDVDAILLLAIDIAANMVTALQHQHRLARLLRLMRKDRTKKTTANNQIIIHDTTPLLSPNAQSTTASNHSCGTSSFRYASNLPPRSGRRRANSTVALRKPSLSPRS